jgi:hypothetical protein
MPLTPPVRRSLWILLRIATAFTCCAGVWSSLNLARADYLFRQDTEVAVRSAIELSPDAWQYYMRLAQLDQPHARALLSTSLRLNRYDAQADVELGLQYEAEGDYATAEQKLLDAYNVDHTYLPRWTLANFYLRRGNMPAFWAWAHSAASMPAEDIGALFELCWRVSPDPQVLTAQLLNDKPEMQRQYIRFLLGKDRTDAVATVAPQLLRAGDPRSDRPLMFAAINQMISDDRGQEAISLWSLLIAQHWVVADATSPDGIQNTAVNNGEFRRDPLPVGFDWWLGEYGGLHSWPGVSGLETEFSGTEPEDCTIAQQAVYLTPGSYTLEYAYRTSDIPEATGIRWQVLDAGSNAMIAESTDLSSEELKHTNLAFSISPGPSLIRLRLGYKRALGTPRVSGSLDVVSIQIRAVHDLSKMR